jgi:translocation and assembly module TamA
VGELERRLLDTGVYESVTVALAPREQADANGLRPVIVSLADRAYRRLELGASYSTSEGAGGDARWTRYYQFRRGDTTSVFARASTIDSRLGVDISLPHWQRARQTLKGSAFVYQQLTSAYQETGVGTSLDVERKFDRTSYVTLGASLDYSRTREVSAGSLARLGRSQIAAALLGAMALDRSDDPLDPKRGWRLEARVEPTLISGDSTLPYLKMQSQGSAYLPFDPKGRTVLAGRLKVGSILGGAIPDVPASRRLYAGGGGSVRGYTYQGVGPVLADNTPQGGLALVEASAELRQKIGQRWGLVGFVDAGSIGSDQIPNGKNLSLGAGFGVRYDLGFGPIRVDIAVPLNPRSNDPSFQIYLSIGQSF